MAIIIVPPSNLVLTAWWDEMCKALGKFRAHDKYLISEKPVVIVSRIFNDLEQMPDSVFSHCVYQIRDTTRGRWLSGWELGFVRRPPRRGSPLTP